MSKVVVCIAEAEANMCNITVMHSSPAEDIVNSRSIVRLLVLDEVWQTDS